jgi:hypothetical protein
MRIRIIEWLRAQEFVFVFEEDLDLPKITMEKVKQQLFDAKVGKDVAQARDALSQKAKTYYSNEALNPRPKRGRPPKQQVKVEIEPQLTGDIYTTVQPACRMFLYLPDISTASGATFSSRYGTEEELLASLRGTTRVKVDTKLEVLSQRLESLRQLSSRLAGIEEIVGEKETKLLKAVSQQEALPPIEEETPKKRGLLDVVKGFLPRRKEKKAEEPNAQKPAAPAVKKVTPIQSKKKK